MIYMDNIHVSWVYHWIYFVNVTCISLGMIPHLRGGVLLRFEDQQQDKTLPVSIVIKFTDAYMRQKGEMSWAMLIDTLSLCQSTITYVIWVLWTQTFSSHNVMRDIVSLLTTVASDDIQWHFNRNENVFLWGNETIVMHKKPFFVLDNVYILLL